LSQTQRHLARSQQRKPVLAQKASKPLDKQELAQDEEDGGGDVDHAHDEEANRRRMQEFINNMKKKGKNGVDAVRERVPRKQVEAVAKVPQKAVKTAMKPVG